MHAFGESGVRENVRPAAILAYNSWLTSIPTWPIRWRNELLATWPRPRGSAGCSREVISAAISQVDQPPFEPRPPPGPPPSWAARAASSQQLAGNLVAIQAANMANQAAADATRAAVSARNAAAWASLAVTSTVSSVVVPKSPIVVTLTSRPHGRQLALPAPDNAWVNFEPITSQLELPGSTSTVGRTVGKS